MGYQGAFSAESGEKVAGKVLTKVLELADARNDDPAGWGQQDWNTATREAVFALDDELRGDDIKAFIAYATEECDGWELMEIGLEASLGAVVWCLWENGG